MVARKDAANPHSNLVRINTCKQGFSYHNYYYSGNILQELAALVCIYVIEDKRSLTSVCGEVSEIFSVTYVRMVHATLYDILCI